MKKPYLCHITTKTGKYAQKEIDGIVELKEFLRGQDVHFSNKDLTNIKNNSVIFHNCYDITYEIEMLFAREETIVDSVRYISVNNFYKKYDICRQTVYKLIRTGKIRSISINNVKLVEDKKPKRKKTNERKFNQI